MKMRAVKWTVSASPRDQLLELGPASLKRFPEVVLGEPGRSEPILEEEGENGKQGEEIQREQGSFSKGHLIQVGSYFSR